MAGPGSSYHLTSLRYAKATSSNTGSLPLLSSDKKESRPRRIDQLFEKAENDYRPGESSSSSLLIRSNVISLESASSKNALTNRDANEGFQRTKARSLLAQSVHTDDMDNDDAMYTNTLIESGASIYMPRRRARNPVSRVSYEENRRKRRVVKDRAKQRAKEEMAAANEAEDDMNEEQSSPRTENDAEFDSGIAHDIRATRDLLPSGSLLETIHYLASHYYDARNMLSSAVKVPAPQNSSDDGEEIEKSRSLFRAYEGNALIALGVYMEEMAKYQVTGSTADVGAVKRSSVNAVKAKERLESVREQIRLNKRRRLIKDKRDARSATTEVTWASLPRRKRKRKTKESTSPDGSSDGGTISERQGEEEDDEEMMTEDRINTISDSSSFTSSQEEENEFASES